MSETKTAPLELVEQIAAINSESAQLRAALGKAISPFALSLDQVLLLKRLNGETKSVSELAEHYQFTAPKMRSVLQSFAELNLAEFVGLPNRGYRLTTLGERVLEKKLPELERLAYFLEHRTNKEELEQLVQLLNTLNTNFFHGH